jgi:hypothetical protein
MNIDEHHLPQAIASLTFIAGNSEIDETQDSAKLRSHLEISESESALTSHGNCVTLTPLPMLTGRDGS